MNRELFDKTERLIRNPAYARAEPSQVKQILEALAVLAIGPNSEDTVEAKEKSSRLQEIVKPESSFPGSTIAK